MAVNNEDRKVMALERIAQVAEHHLEIAATPAVAEAMSKSHSVDCVGCMDVRAAAAAKAEKEAEAKAKAEAAAQAKLDAEKKAADDKAAADQKAADAKAASDAAKKPAKEMN